MSGAGGLGLRLLLTLALYAFLGWTLWTIAQDLRRTGDRLSTRRIPPIRVDFLDGSRGTISRTFDQAEITVGRDPHCEGSLDDETVSARHARLKFHHEKWWTEHPRSTNGTSLNPDKQRTPPS